MSCGKLRWAGVPRRLRAAGPVTVTDDSLPSGGKRDILEEGAAVRAQRVAAHEGGRYGKGDRDRESGL